MIMVRMMVSLVVMCRKGYPASSSSSVTFLFFEALHFAMSSSLASLSPPLNLEVDLEDISLVIS